MRKQDRIANQQQSQSGRESQNSERMRGSSDSERMRGSSDSERMKDSGSETQRQQRQTGKLPLPD
jgi:hypothetical protein